MQYFMGIDIYIYIYTHSVDVVMGRYIYIYTEWGQNGKIGIWGGKKNESLSFDLMDIRVSTNKMFRISRTKAKQSSLICRGF